MTALDATGLQAIEELADALHQAGRHLVLCGARHQPADLMKRARFHEHVGAQNICAHVEDALKRARDLHNTTRREVG
jgi:SulP family sulfate permease